MPNHNMHRVCMRILHLLLSMDYLPRNLTAPACVILR